VDADVALGGPLGSSELGFQPRQPIAVTAALFALDQQPSDLDDVGDDALTEGADLLSSVGEEGGIAQSKILCGRNFRLRT
jgi:hypothetical protein